MKYENKTFNFEVGTKAYREGWERIFGKKKEVEEKEKPAPWPKADDAHEHVDFGDTD